MPFTMNGMVVFFLIAASSAAVFGPTGWPAFVILMIAAASISIPKASAPAAAASCAFSMILSVSRGLITGMPRPPTARIALRPASKTSAIGPSPVMPTVPTWWQPPTTFAAYSGSVVAPPMFSLPPAIAAPIIGIDSCMPRMLHAITGSFISCTTFMFSR